MAVICYPHLSGKISMKDGTPVNIPDDHTGKYLKFKYTYMVKLNSIMFKITKPKFYTILDGFSALFVFF